VQLTTLLDTVYQGVSTTGADDFDRLVADLIPCRTHDPELWFAEHTAQVEQAKALCRTCPLLEGCLAGAIEREEPWGVWGGEVFVGGQVVATKRGRGRPRKDTVYPAA
jgi:WhiB family redox-sensing transcriptional regulator